MDPTGRRARTTGCAQGASRSNPEPIYRSDAIYFERIYGEALIDLSPEEVADSVRTRF